MPVHRPISLLEFLPLVKAGASEETAMPYSFLPFCRMHPFPLPGRLLDLPSFLPLLLLPAPEPTQVSPLPRSAAAHRFRFFFLIHSQQPEVRLNHSRISSCEYALLPLGVGGGVGGRNNSSVPWSFNTYIYLHWGDSGLGC